MDKFNLDEFDRKRETPRRTDDKDVYFSNLASNANKGADKSSTSKLNDIDPPKIYHKDDLASKKTTTNTPVTPTKTTKQKKNNKKQNDSKHSVRSTYVFFIVVICVSMALSIYAILCMNDVLAITKTTSSVTISFDEEIKSTGQMIDLLAKNDLIECKGFCKTFVKLRDTFIDSSKIGAPYEPGMYYLNGKMGLEGMLLTLKGNNQTSETIKITFPEGFTASQIIERLSDNDVCDKAALLSVIESTEYSYSLVTDLKAKEEVPYRLEGYLFPDTYEFYIGESASSVIKKFLDNGDSKFTKEYRDRAQSMGYTTNEIITIASIIQKEAADESQMKTVSAVLHNRLKDPVNFPTLGCDSTSFYITNKVAPFISSTSSHTADYYLQYYNTGNKSTTSGLPPSPICNPGIAAIEAALYPAQDDSLFFFHDNEGKIYTSKTLKENKEKMQKYAPYLLH